MGRLVKIKDPVVSPPTPETPIVVTPTQPPVVVPITPVVVTQPPPIIVMPTQPPAPEFFYIVSETATLVYYMNGSFSTITITRTPQQAAVARAYCMYRFAALLGANPTLCDDSNNW